MPKCRLGISYYYVVVWRLRFAVNFHINVLAAAQLVEQGKFAALGSRYLEFLGTKKE